MSLGAVDTSGDGRGSARVQSVSSWHLRGGEGSGWLRGAGDSPARLAPAAVFAFQGFAENERDFFYLVSREFILVEN